MKWTESCSVLSDSLWSHGLYSPWNSQGQNTGVGSFSLLHNLDTRQILQGIFPTQISNPGLLHCRQILYQLSFQGSPSKLRYGICFLAFQPSRSHLYSLAQGPFSIFRASSLASSNLTLSLSLPRPSVPLTSASIVASLPVSLLPSSCEDLCN